MKKKNRKHAPKPVLTERARAYQKHILQTVLHSPWFWTSIIFGLMFLAVFLAAASEAGIRYQGYYDAGTAFNTAWLAATHAHDATFVVHNPVRGGNLTYWFSTAWFQQNGYTAIQSGKFLDIYTDHGASLVAKLPILGEKSFSYTLGKWQNHVMFVETSVFFTPFWTKEIVVADNSIWDWLSQPLFGKYPYEVKSLERGQEAPNADIYKCLVYYYSPDTPDVWVNLSFFAALWPKSMNMNWGYWIIAVSFLTAFAISFCVFCSYMMKLRKTFRSEKKDDENTLAKYLEAEADNMHFKYDTPTPPVVEEGVKPSGIPATN